MADYNTIAEVKDSFQKNHKIYIYGAGAYAFFLTKEFEKEGVEITGYLVSSETVDNRYNLKNVQRFSDVDIDEEVVIIGVQQPKYVQEIETQLGNLKHVVKFNPDMVRWQFVNREKVTEISRTKGYFSSKKNLQKIGEAEHTDKAGTDHNYLNKYEFFLKKFEDNTFTFVELGVFKGSSIKMWRQFFKNAKVIGVDIDESCKQYARDDIEILIRDLGLDSSIEEIATLKPSVIVDDASHIWSHQINALLKLYPVLPSGGVYILEDISTSFFPASACYADGKVSAYDVIEIISKGVVGDSQPDMDYKGLEALKPQIDEIIRTTEVVVNMADSVILIKR